MASATVTNDTTATATVDTTSSGPTAAAAAPLSTDQQIVALRRRLRADLNACDMQWSLFVAAAQSLRYNSKLSPYPPRYAIRRVPPGPSSALSDAAAGSAAPDELDVGAILRLIAAMPRLTRIVWSKLRAECIDLLHWVLCVHGAATVRLQSVHGAAEHRRLLGQSSDHWMPPALHVFRVLDGLNAQTGEPTSSAERRFAAYVSDEEGRTRDTLHAFHGSRLENFHSISAHGLHQHLSDRAVFGNGIYLSSEPSVSLPYSQMGGGWRMTGLGTELSCMAICEFVDDERHMKRQLKDRDGAMDDDMPDKYFVITNNEIVRVRYLVVFGKPLVTPPPPLDDGYVDADDDVDATDAVAARNQRQLAEIRSAAPAQLATERRLRGGFLGHVRQAVADNLALSAVLFYGLLLLALGVAYSESGRYWRHRWAQSVQRFMVERGWYVVDEATDEAAAATIADLTAALRQRLERGNAAVGGGGSRGEL